MALADQFKPLTKNDVRTIREPGRYREGTVRGLYLQVIHEQNRSWLLRYVIDGRERWMGLGSAGPAGSAGEVTLDDARDAALGARRMLREKKDPLAERKRQHVELALKQARTITFRDAVEKYHAHHSAKWTNEKHAAQFKTSLETHAYPVLGKLPVADIDTALVIRVLEPIWQTTHKTAVKVRGRIERVLGWAAVNEYRTGENPARWKGHLKEALALLSQTSVKHHKALPYAEAPALMAWLKDQGGMAPRALQFLLLTAVRTGEVLGARWSEIDLDAARWEIPAGRMKAREPHRVPLSAPAVALLKDLPRVSDFVFPGRKGHLNADALRLFLKRKNHAEFDVHGLRSTFGDWSDECSSFEDKVSEKALAHKVGNKTRRAYKRGDLFDQRRLLMDAWAKYLTSPKIDGTVTPISAARKVANG